MMQKVAELTGFSGNKLVRFLEKPTVTCIADEIVITMDVFVWHEIYWLIRNDMSHLLGVVHGNKSAVLNIFSIEAITK